MFFLTLSMAKVINMRQRLKLICAGLPFQLHLGVGLDWAISIWFTMLFSSNVLSYKIHI